jgi:hypothetical protein
MHAHTSAVLLLLISAYSLSGQIELSKTPPPVYSEHLEQFLTPIDEVLEGRDSYQSTTDGGIVLLKENATFISDDGTRYSLNHRIDYTDNESGIEINKQYTHSYDKERQKIYLIKAGTHQADGTFQEVDDIAAFIQTPQNNASDSLYTSDAELTIIFPNVKKGSIVESIILVETFEPLIPGEISLGKSLCGYWPTYRSKITYVLPNWLSKRIKTKGTTGLVPKPKVGKYSETHEIYEWDAKQLPDFDYEQLGMRGSKTLPFLIISSLDTWDKFGEWFSGLVDGQDILGEQLQQLADSWTEGVTDRSELISILGKKVSNEVRYTGLEFGKAGFKPYSCSMVWGNRYGDCKDKSNLLRALLRYKGIDAHMALLYTKHQGNLEKELPWIFQFNHAIVAVPDGNNDYILIDPTIDNITPGTLGFGCNGRDVLIIKEDGVAWKRTKDILRGTIALDFDLSLKLDGEFSGWAKLKTEGVDASSYKSHFDDVDIFGQKTRFLEIVSNFYSTARIVDLEIVEPKENNDVFEVRGYIITNPQQDYPENIKFPYSVNWLPAFQVDEERETPYQTTRRKITVNSHISLPPGMHVKDFPDAFYVDSKSLYVNAMWESSNENVGISFEYYPRKMILTPEEYEAFKNGVSATKAWMKQDLFLTFNPEESKKPATRAHQLADFPLLSSGDGQLSLVDERYPEGKNNEQRKKALEQTIQWFASDSSVVFQAKVKMALLIWDTDPQGFVKQLESALELHGQKASINHRAWAEFLWARGKWVNDKDPEALRLLRDQSENKDLSNYRRGFAAYYYAKFLSEKNPNEALKIIESALEYESEAIYYLDKLYSLLSIKTNNLELLKDHINNIKNTSYENLISRSESILLGIDEGFSEIDEDQKSQLLNILEETYTPMLDRLNEQSSDTYKKISNEIRKKDLRNEFIERFINQVRNHSPAWFEENPNPNLTAGDFISQIESANESGETHQLLNAFTNMVLSEKGTYDELVKYFRWFLWWLEDPSLYFDLGELSLKLIPDTQAEYFQLMLMYGDSHLREGNSEASKYFARIIETSLEDYQKAKAHYEIAKIAITEGRTATARDHFEKMESIYFSNTNGTDFLVIFMLFMLEQKQFEEGLRLLAKLPEMEQKWVDQSTYSILTTNLRRSAPNQKEILKYWENEKNWWGTWSQLCEEYDVNPGSVENVWRSMGDISLIENSISTAIYNKDSSAFLEGLKPIILAAKWAPIFIADIYNHIRRLNEVNPILQKKLQSMLLIMCSANEGVDPEYEENVEIVELVTLNDVGDYERVPEKAKNFIDQTDSDRSFKETALRCWLIATREMGQGFDEVSERMESWLASDEKLDNRPLSVTILSDGYYFLNEFDNLISLIEREISHPEIQENEATKELLVLRRDIALNTIKSSEEFANSVKTWVKNVGLDFFDEILPKELDSNNPLHMEGPIFYDYMHDGSLKENILFSLDKTKPLEERRRSFCYALLVYAHRVNNIEEVERAIWEALEVVKLSEDDKIYLVEWISVGFLENFYHEQTRRILNSKYAQGADPEWLQSTMAVVESAELYLKLPETKIAKSLDPILDAKITYNTEIFINQLINRLIYLDQMEEVKELLEKTKQLTVLYPANKNLHNYRLGWLRLAKKAEIEREFIRELRSLILGDQVVADEVPSWFSELQRHNYLAEISEKSQIEIILYSVKTGIFKFCSIYQLANIYRGIHQKENKLEDFGLDFFRLIEKHLGNDLIDSARVNLGIIPDIDIPEIYREYQEITNRLRKNSNLGEKTKVAIEYLDLSFLIRKNRKQLKKACFRVQATSFPYKPS